MISDKEFYEEKVQALGCWYDENVGWRWNHLAFYYNGNFVNVYWTIDDVVSTLQISYKTFCALNREKLSEIDAAVYDAEKKIEGYKREIDQVRPELSLTITQSLNGKTY